MRILNGKELESVSGGDWSFEVDLGVVKFTVSGDESIQDMAGGLYDGAVGAIDGFLNMFEGDRHYFSSCSGGGGR